MPGFTVIAPAPRRSLMASDCTGCDWPGVWGGVGRPYLRSPPESSAAMRSRAAVTHHGAQLGRAI